MHLLEINPELIHEKTGSHRQLETPTETESIFIHQPNSFTPLHIASSTDRNTLSTNILIQKQALVEAKDFEGKTPLHIAARNGCRNNVIALIFNGKANLIAKDFRNETPLHLAKSSKILDIFLHKIDIQELLAADEDFRPNLGNDTSRKKPLFDIILQNHPSSMKTYLDSMVTTTNQGIFIH